MDGKPQSTELPRRSRDDSDVTDDHAGFQFAFDVDATQLSAQARARFVRLGLDPQARSFIDGVLRQPAGRLRTISHTCLRQLLSDFDANAVLAMYPMHLLSTEQFALLLRRPGEPVTPTFETGLDVGAGNGDVTSQLAPLCQRIVVTEQSRGMRWGLKRLKYEVVSGDMNQHGPYALVSCLNVIDRTQRPAALVSRLSALVAAGGKLILSSPLPLEPFFYSGPRSLAPEEPLPEGTGSWEHDAEALIRWCRRRLPGFELTALTRAPYLSGGDRTRSLYSLDSCVLVWHRPDD